MSYSYTTGTNKLKHITETGTSGSADFAVNSGAVGDYYSYDEIGQLTKDQHADISEITWTLQGKVKKITFEDNAELEFKYDPLGNRLMKIYRPSTSNVLDNEITWVYTYYERDAQGQVMGIYEQTFSNTTGDEYSSDIKLNDLVIYGSDRLGTEQTEFHDQYLFCSNSYTNKLFDVDGTCNLTSYPLGGTTASLDPGYAVCLPCTTEFDRGTTTGKLMLFSEHPVIIKNNNYGMKSWPTINYGSNSGTDEVKTFDANQYIELDFGSGNFEKFEISGDNGIVWVAQTFGTPMTFDNSGSVISDGSGGGPVDPRYESKKIDYTRTLDNKKYELKNHLGNVLSVVSDRKLGVDPDTDNDFDYYTADIKSYSDYYPFGAVMPGRNGNSTDYRFGFQGQVKDDEIKGANNSLNYKYRIHDPRVGRFFSVDPLTAEYPWNSPYAFSENRVIDGVELEGLEYERAAMLVNDDRQRRMARGEKVTAEDLYATLVVSAVGVGAASALILGPEVVATFVANEVKDEVLSQATGGASDVYDFSKVMTNIARTGLRKSAKSVNKLTEFKDLAKTGKINSKSVRFSQNSIKSTFQDGGKVSDLTKALQEGKLSANDVPAIRITEKDGKIFSLDNRRLKAFQDAGVDINYEKVDYNSLSKKDLNKFTTTNNGSSIQVRSQNGK